MRSSPCWYIFGRTWNISNTNFWQVFIKTEKICRRHSLLRKVNTVNDILNKSNGFHQNINLHKNWKVIISYHFWKFYWFVIIIMSRLLLIKSQLTVTYIWIGKHFHSVRRNAVLWRACLICSTPKYLQEELDRFSYVFQKLSQLSY